MNRFARLATALDFAAEAHQAQTRKGSDIPYLCHLMGVASLVIEHGGDEEQAIAGLLHDVIEDCGAPYEQRVRETFGDRVAQLVLACTDGAPDEAGEKAPWRERKEAYLQHLEHDASDDAVLVSACDKLHNARAIATDAVSGKDVYSRFTAGREGTHWYYASLASIIEARLGRSSALATELRHTVKRMMLA